MKFLPAILFSLATASAETADYPAMFSENVERQVGKERISTVLGQSADAGVNPSQARPVMGGDGKSLDVSPVAYDPDDRGASGNKESIITEDPFQLKFFGSLQNQMAMGFASLTDTRDEFFATWDIGIDHNILEGHNHVYTYEIDAGWKRYLNSNLAIVLGRRFSNEDGTGDRAFAGIDWWLPYKVRTLWQVDGRGDLRVGLAKSIRITERLEWFSAVRYDTGTQWNWTMGADYLLTRHFSLVAQYHSDEGLGLGLGFRF